MSKTQTDGRPHEPALAQFAGFLELFVWLLVLKSFFLPLFIIPTGSMAETLMGEYATHLCPNCGYEYPVNYPDPRSLHRTRAAGPAPRFVRCPNCHLLEDFGRARMAKRAGDRIMVHGWTYPFGGDFGPQRWDVVVFRYPEDGQTNFIKRLIGLPGEEIEIIDGDVFVNGTIARKPADVQESLWFNVFDQNHRPREPFGDYFPRWQGEVGGAWTEVDTRRPRFAVPDGQTRAMHFVTDKSNPNMPGIVLDMYGYNPPIQGADRDLRVVNDVRLSAEVEFAAGSGYVELLATKYDDAYLARLHRGGRVELVHVEAGGGAAELWETVETNTGDGPVWFALSVVDYRVLVTVGDHVLIDRALEVTADEARQRSGLPIARRVPRLQVRASGVEGSLADLKIERDVFYTPARLGPHELGHGVMGNPITLADGAYYMLGDNSPRSADSRLWQEVGPHLAKAYAEGEYELGTVPEDQLIGKAFLVYWPGFMPLFEGGPNLLPDLGRVRWIH